MSQSPFIQPSDNATISTADTSNVFHSWSAQASLAPIPIASGSGVKVWDFDGKEYLDFSSQLVNVNIGYQHPAVVTAIQEQAARLATIGPAYANDARAKAAQKILEHAPEGFHKIFFTNGGADAIENAIRMARLHTGRDKVISRYRSYHGNTGAAIVATGDWRRIPNEYATGHVHVFGPYAYRSNFWATTPEEDSARALEHLERTVVAEGPSSIAAILLEAIPGTAGVIMPTAEYMQGAREIATRYGIMLIIDEVMAGFGRTGKWLAHEHFGITPDLITFAKGVNSGYVPAGGVMISDPIAKTFDDRVFPGGLTYSGHPLAMASIVATIEAMEQEGVVENAATIGETVIGPRLEAMASRLDVIGEVRGVGVFWAIELVADPVTKEPLPAAEMGAIKKALMDNGLLPFIADNRIHVVPPCVITADEAETGLAIIEKVLSER